MILSASAISAPTAPRRPESSAPPGARGATETRSAAPHDRAHGPAPPRPCAAPAEARESLVRGRALAAARRAPVYCGPAQAGWLIRLTPWAPAQCWESTNRASTRALTPSPRLPGLGGTGLIMRTGHDPGRRGAARRASASGWKAARGRVAPRSHDSGRSNDSDRSLDPNGKMNQTREHPRGLDPSHSRLSAPAPWPVRIGPTLRLASRPVRVTHQLSPSSQECNRSSCSHLRTTSPSRPRAPTRHGVTPPGARPGPAGPAGALAYRSPLAAATGRRWERGRGRGPARGMWGGRGRAWRRGRGGGRGWGRRGRRRRRSASPPRRSRGRPAVERERERERERETGREKGEEGEAGRGRGRETEREREGGVRCWKMGGARGKGARGRRSLSLPYPRPWVPRAIPSLFLLPTRCAFPLSLSFSLAPCCLLTAEG